MAAEGGDKGRDAGAPEGAPAAGGEAKAPEAADQAGPDAAAQAAAPQAAANAEKQPEASPKAAAQPDAKPEKQADKQAEKQPDKKAEKQPDKKAEKQPDKKAETKPEKKPEPEHDPTQPPPAPPWWQTLREDPPAHIRLALGAGLVGIIVFVWWFCTRGDMVQVQFNGRTQLLTIKFLPSVDRIIEAGKLPSPGDVITSLDELYDRELFKNLIETLQRVMIGVGLAAFVGILLGIVAASYRGLNAAVAPLVIFLRSVPMGALIPLTLMAFGTGESQKTRFIFLAVVPFVFSDTVKAISVVPERYIETALTLGASRFQIIRKVLVPLALPDIITSLRFLLGLALGYIMLAEEINTEYGIGKLILGSQRQGPYEHVYLILFIIAIVALVIDLVLRTLQRGLFAWRKDL